MKRIILAAALLAASYLASAANYNVAVSWTDPTPASANYVAAFDVETRIAGGTAVRDAGVATTSFTKTVVANAGDKIEARVRARNTVGPIDGPWTVWFAATAPTAPTTPLAPTGVVITITVQ
jgi:hypothetical protein